MIFLYYLVHFYTVLIFIRILMSWFPFDPHNTIVDMIVQITDPYLNIFRRLIPPIGMIDFSPIVALIILQAIAQMFLTMA